MKNIKFIFIFCFILISGVMFFSLVNEAEARPIVAGHVKNAYTGVYYPVDPAKKPQIVWCDHDTEVTDNCNNTPSCVFGNNIPASIASQIGGSTQGWYCRFTTNTQTGGTADLAYWDLNNKLFVFDAWDGEGFGCSEDDHFVTGVPDSNFPGTFSKISFTDVYRNGGGNSRYDIQLDDLIYTPSTVTISGKVMDSSTSAGIANVVISAPCGIGTSSTSGANGVYSFSNITWGLNFCLRPPLTPPLGYQNPPNPISYANQTADANKNNYNFIYTPVPLPQGPTNLSAVCPSPGEISYINWACQSGATGKIIVTDQDTKIIIANDNLTQSPLITRNTIPSHTYKWTAQCCWSGVCSPPSSPSELTCTIQSYLKTSGGDVHSNQ